MRKRGEITVFLSLVMVCVLSLFLSFVESARTTGARLYLQMAANSAVSSVMSQYNRNLWNMYHLLFLEADSDDAVEESFALYLKYSLEQRNLYPMKIDQVEVTEKTMMTDNGGQALEQEILSYVKYRIPDVAADMAGVMEAAADAKKAGDVQELFDVCRQTGKNTRKLEKSRIKVENCLKEIRESLEQLDEAVGQELDNEEDEKKWHKKVQRCADDVTETVKKLSEVINRYETEIEAVSSHVLEMKQKGSGDINEDPVENGLLQEMEAYEMVVSASEESLRKYREAERKLEETLSLQNVELWEINDMISAIDDACSYGDSIDAEKAAALNRLEELFQGDLLELVLPENQSVSKKRVDLSGCPSLQMGKKTEGVLVSEMLSSGVSVAGQCMINEYCFFVFDSFFNQCERKLEPLNQPLLYEQEYLLCGKKSDRENLQETVERLLMIRASMNLLFLLQSSEHRMAVEGFAAAVSGGVVPIQVILSFFILSLWALGEAVCDVKMILNRQRVPFWKSQEDWNLSIDELLTLKFVESFYHEETIEHTQDRTSFDDKNELEHEEKGNDYQDYLRILFLLMDKTERNGRMMDVIQWNVGTVQEDFLVSDCIADIHLRAEVTEQHLFMVKTKYHRIVEVVGDY